ncbi:MAG: YceI family protein [Ferruginibacter sp.]|nr:YceI family protein [Ferruginibacter sp.]
MFIPKACETLYKMYMKNLLLAFAATISVTCMVAQNYTPVDNGSDIKFSIKNFGLTVNGRFKGLKGRITFNPANVAAASFSATVDATTVNTGNGTRDGHLKKEEYFNAGKYPVISLVSTGVTNATAGGSFNMEAKITIKGITKAVSFPFKATQKADGYLFEGAFKLNRRDFGVGGKSVVMSDNLTVSLSVFAKKN